MRRKIALGFLLNLLICTAALALSHGKPKGFVNDLPNLLPKEEEAEIEKTLKEYKAKTDIEIAVVIVLSLEGLEIEEYTQELAESWGVGKRGKDNGIVFLIAPNERKLRIATGYGIEPDLTDYQAKQIIDNHVVPLFKSGRMVDGVKSGLRQILSELGTAPYKARVAEREGEAEKRAVEEKLQAENNARKMKFFFAALAVCVVGLVATLAIIAVIKRRARLMKIWKMCQGRLKHVEKQLTEIQRDKKARREALILLKSISPEKVWGEFQKENEALEDVSAYNEELKKIQRAHIRGWKFAEDTSGQLNALNGIVASAFALLSEILAKVKSIKKANRESVEELSALPKLFEEISIELRHPDVQAKSLEILEKAKQLFEKANASTAITELNWLTVRELLGSARSFAADARASGKSDMHAAVEARAEGPKLFKKMPRYIAEAEEEMGDSDVSRSAAELVKKAKRKYNEAVKAADASPINWLAVYAVLVAALALVKRAKEQADEEKEDARRRRRQAEAAAYAASRRNDDTSYSSWSSSSSSGGFSSGGGSSSDSGFSFGGGSFGGGGASGSW